MRKSIRPTGSSAQPASDQLDVRRAIVRRLKQVAVQFVVIVAILFVASGRLDWGWAWAYVATAIGLLAVNARFVRIQSDRGHMVRTALEDRALRAELPGYEEYAQRVRYRLLPGVW